VRVASAVRLAAAGVLAVAAAGGFIAAPASAAAVTGDATGYSQVLGRPPVAPVGSCPFGQTNVASFTMLSGSMVNHGTSNTNGDWGGQTISGIALFTVGSVSYTGHLTYWNGGGNNAQSQFEFGFTLNFKGTGSGGGLSINLHGHATSNANGVMTVSNPPSGSIICS